MAAAPSFVEYSTQTSNFSNQITFFHPKDEFHSIATTTSNSVTQDLSSTTSKKSYFLSLLSSHPNPNPNEAALAGGVERNVDLREELVDDGFLQTLTLQHFISNSKVLNHHAKISFSSDSVPISWTSNFQPFGVAYQVAPCNEVRHSNEECIAHAESLLHGKINTDFPIEEVLVAVSETTVTPSLHFQLNDLEGNPQFEVAVDVCSLALTQFTNYQAN